MTWTGITRDEFGVDLFAAIKAASGRHVLLIRAKALPEAKRAAVLATAETLRQDLERLLMKGTIAPHDVRGILARYPGC
jgi:hypothetical protein